MIGLHLLNKKFSRFYSDSHSNEYFEFKNFNITISYHKQYEKQVFIENSDYVVFIDGWIMNEDASYESQGEYLIHLYKKHKEQTPGYVNGQFNVLICDKKSNEFLFFNDIFAFRKHVISTNNNNEILYLGSDIHYAKSILDEKELDLEVIKKSIDNARYLNIKETYFRNIKFVPPHTALTTKGISSYNLKLRFEYSDQHSWYLDKYFNTLKKNIGRLNNDDSINLVLLSGGLDSRFLLELLGDSGQGIVTATYGNIQSEELKIAKNVAKAHDIENYQVHLEPKDFLSHARNYIMQTGGMDIFVQGTVYKFYDKLMSIIDSKSIIDTGFALDALLGTSYDSSLSELPGFENEGFIENRVFSKLALRQSAHREFLEDRYSMYEYSNYFMTRRIPKDLRTNQFYIKIARENLKRSRDIPLQSTMFDLNLHEDLWREAENIQNERDVVFEKNYSKTNLLSPHHRYYSDFDSWLRKDDHWNEFYESLFINSQLERHKIIPSGSFYHIYSLHKKGADNYRRKLIQLASLELLLKNNE